MNHYVLENNCYEGRGSIEVICGSMFSGKTEELIRRLKRAKIANQSVKIFKAAIDTRYDDILVVSHNGNKVESTPLQKASDVMEHIDGVDVIGIDEVQFFDQDIIKVVEQLSDMGKRVIVAGLDMDFKRNPFGPMPALCAIADSVEKVHAICMDCGRVANYSYRKIQKDDIVMLGEMNEYMPLCRTCYLRHNDNNNQ